MRYLRMACNKDRLIIIGLLGLYLAARFVEFAAGSFLGDQDGIISGKSLQIFFTTFYAAAVVALLLYLIFRFFFTGSNAIQPKRGFLDMFVFMVFIFFISSNLAWLNPRPSFRSRGGDHVKLSEVIPLFWQYNLDSKLELETAQFFPHYYEHVATRINRPAYPLLVNSLGRIIAPGFIQTRNTASAGYLILKFSLYLLAAVCLLNLTHTYLPYYGALAAIILVFSSSFSIQMMCTYHTSELQILTPIFIFFLLADLSSHYSLRKNIGYGLIIGCLMLAKQNYSAYLAAIVFALLYGRIKEVVINVIAHLLPLLNWLGYLYATGIIYYNHEMEHYRQGVWLVEDFRHYEFLLMVKTLLISLKDYCIAFFNYFGPFSLFAIIGAMMMFVYLRNLKHLQLLLILFILTEWFQTFAAWRFDSYMTSGMSIFIFPFSVYAVHKLDKRWKWIATAAAAAWLIFNIYRMINFPWIHPYNQ